jgi:anhydro-N-acetylmuramic acid kinase
MLHHLLRIIQKPRRRIVGLMSGTSADGVDAALVEVEGSGVGTKARLIAFECLPYPPALRADVLALCDATTGRVDQVCRMNALLGEWFSEAARRVVRKAGLEMADVDLIGSHGQTIHHLPEPTQMHGYAVRSTLQVGDPCVIAERTGVATVGDFRVRDVAAGGQGAPLVPLVDYLLYRSETAGRAMLNVGGIANATILPAACGLEDVYAFDLGPGNMVIDRLMDRITGGRASYDEGGQVAGTGRVHPGLLSELMTHPFFSLPPPKSTGREDFGAAYADAFLARARDWGLSDADAVATATAFTAQAVADGLRRFVREPVQEVIVSGGGARNETLMSLLRARLRGVRGIEEVGGSTEAKEALAFAVLANETLAGGPGNVPRVTGASHPAVLGKIAPA